MPPGEFSHLQIDFEHRTWTGALSIYLFNSVQTVMPVYVLYFTLSAYTDLREGFDAGANVVHGPASIASLCACSLDNQSQREEEIIFDPRHVWSGHGIWYQTSI